MLEKVHVTGREITVEVTVAGRPARAAIDPYNKLIDRTPGDNVLPLSLR